MEMKIEIVKKAQYHTTKWSGGTTTELLIYPSDSKYSERSFKWRISSAKVEESESIFTNLPGITRHIMITDGRIILEHQNKYKKELEAFNQDSFMGDWKTKSYGKATDFNLMLSHGLTGKLIAYSLEEEEEIDIILNDNNRSQITNIFYVLNGSLEFSINKQKFNVEEKDLLYITGLPIEDERIIKLTNKSNYKLRVIRTVIWE
jgi:uncharacterized protein